MLFLAMEICAEFTCAVSLSAMGFEIASFSHVVLAIIGGELRHARRRHQLSFTANIFL